MVLMMLRMQQRLLTSDILCTLCFPATTIMGRACDGTSVRRAARACGARARGEGAHGLARERERDKAAAAAARGMAACWARRARARARTLQFKWRALITNRMRAAQRSAAARTAARG